MKIVNDDSRIIKKLEASLTDDARVVIYDRQMFIVQATGFRGKGKLRDYENAMQNCENRSCKRPLKG